MGFPATHLWFKKKPFSLKNALDEALKIIFFKLNLNPPIIKVFDVPSEEMQSIHGALLLCTVVPLSAENALVC